MSQFKQHTIESAPEGSRPILEGTKKALGFVPNLYATFAGSPAALHAYTQIDAALSQHGALSHTERNLVAIFMSRENDCGYCVAAHTAIAGMGKAPADLVQAARDGASLGNVKLEALRDFSVGVIRNRGRLGDRAVQDFLDAGWEQRHVLDVLTVAALKTLSNYANHIADTPLDEAFKPVEWHKAA